MSKRCLVIAEVAQAHDGSLGTAHSYIDAVARSGADVVKFQAHIAAAESTPNEPWRVRFSPQDETRYDYWRRMEFTEDQWRGLKQHATDRKLAFYCSPFSLEAVDMLSRVGVAGWKVASGEVNNTPLFDRIAAAGLPFLVSTGMSSIAEVDLAVRKVREHGLPLTIMQCTSMYPTPPTRVGLNVLGEYKARYGCEVGLSDHSGTIFPALAAVTLGASVVEVHVAFSREVFGPDVTSSVTVDELHTLVRGIRFLEECLSNPVDKDRLADDFGALRIMFGKSVVLRVNVSEGTVLRAEHLTAKKPGTGIPATRLQEYIGRQTRRSLSADTLLREEDLS